MERKKKEVFSVRERVKKTSELSKLLIPDKFNLFSELFQPHSHEEAEMRTNVGLVKGHAYGITAVRKINIGDTGLFSIFKYGLFENLGFGCLLRSLFFCTFILGYRQ